MKCDNTKKKKISDTTASYRPVSSAFLLSPEPAKEPAVLLFAFRDLF